MFHGHQLSGFKILTNQTKNNQAYTHTHTHTHTHTNSKINKQNVMSYLLEFTNILDHLLVLLYIQIKEKFEKINKKKRKKKRRKEERMIFL